MKKSNQITHQAFFPEKRSVFFKMDSTVKKARQMLGQLFEMASVDLTVDQWVLIERLYVNRKVSQNQLAFLSAKDEGTTTRILDLLCKKDFTIRVPSSTDRRSFDVELTSKGRAVFKMAQKEAIEIRKKGFGRLSDLEYSKFCEMLDKVYEDLNSGNHQIAAH